MTRLNLVLVMTLTSLSFFSCVNRASESDFRYTIDEFADFKIIRYTVPGWDSLTLKEKELVYYLSQAALCGRDITYDQNFKHNLLIRKTFESIAQTYSGDKSTPDYQNFLEYLKCIWIGSGIHHPHSTDKFIPKFNEAYLAELMTQSDLSSVLLAGQSIDELKAFLVPILFDPNLYAKRVNLDESKGLIESSAANFYDSVSTQEVETFYQYIAGIKTNTPISYGLNSRLVKRNGRIFEDVYRVGGLYGAAIEKIVFWLEKASSVAENPLQAAHIQKLIEYYQTGDLKTWDQYNVLWVQDSLSKIDYVNGFIETYGDPMGMKAGWESVVNFKDFEATKRTTKISENAQWFEDHSPIDPRFKKERVVGVSAKVITVAQLGGECQPTTPIGINLPNADWIRRDYGSKSVTMANITYAYARSSDESTQSALNEFAYSEQEKERAKTHGALADNLHTDLHECLGHGSGKLLPTTSSEALKNHSSALEETRADLFALYYMMDDKLVELGIVPSLEVGKTEYDSYIRKGLLEQLTRIQAGKDIVQAHMRCRALISRWAYEHGKSENVIEKIVKDGKTYFVVNDHQKLRELFGKLLAELQRIKSEGDYEAGKNLIETYAVKIDPELHQEVLTRYEKLQLKPYGGFVNPEFKLVHDAQGQLTDIAIEYPSDFSQQMLNYSKQFSFLQ